MRSLLRFGLLTCAGLALVAPLPASAASKNFVAVLNGGQEVPPTASGAVGTGFFTLDTMTGMVCYAISYTTLTAARLARYVVAQVNDEIQILLGHVVVGGEQAHLVVLARRERKTKRHGRRIGRSYASGRARRRSPDALRGQAFDPPRVPPAKLLFAMGNGCAHGVQANRNS